MALLLVLFGGVLVDVGFRGTGDQLGALLKTDVPGFVPWGGAMLLIGALGYAKPLRTPSHLLLLLVILVLFLTNHGIFANLQQAFTHPPAASQPEGLISPTDAQALQAGPTVNVNLPNLGSSNNPITGAANAAAGFGAAIGKFLGLF